MGHEHLCFMSNALKMCDLWNIFGEWFIASLPQLKKKKKVFSSVVETEVIKHYFYILKMLKDVKIKCGTI